MKTLKCKDRDPHTKNKALGGFIVIHRHRREKCLKIFSSRTTEPKMHKLTTTACLYSENSKMLKS